MSHNLNLAELAKRLAVNIPDQFLQELEHDLDEELRSIRLYEDTLSTLEELKKLGFRLALCSNLAMPYGKVVSSFLPSLDAYAWSYEPYQVCRRLNILRDYSDEKTKLYPRN